MAVNYFLTGKIALFGMLRTDGTVGTGTLPVTTASIATKIDTPDASSFATNGFTGLVPGIKSAEITVEILYDKLALPPIFAGMKADVSLNPTGGRAAFLTALVCCFLGSSIWPEDAAGLLKTKRLVLGKLLIKVST